MACDLCGAKGTPLADLLDGYKTTDIQAVCPACEKVLNTKLWKIRSVLDGSMRTLLKRWMGEQRAAAFAAIPPEGGERKGCHPLREASRDCTYCHGHCPSPEGCERAERLAAGVEGKSNG